jgi:prepilin-type N-terminal cleavage/methylation domain-containing protein
MRLWPGGGRRLAAREDGFTLLELLIVVQVLGILLAIAFPSFLSFKLRALKSAAQANVRAAVEGVEGYSGEHGTGYSGLTLTKLQASYDSGIKNVKIVRASKTSYCYQNTIPGTVTYKKPGPGAAITAGVC